MNKMIPIVLVIVVIAVVALLMMASKAPATGGSQKPSGQPPSPAPPSPAPPSPVPGGTTPPVAQSTHDYITALHNMLSGTNPYCDYTKLAGITSVFTNGADVDTTEYTVADGRITQGNSGDITSFVETGTCGRTPIDMAFALMYLDIYKAKAAPVGSWMTAVSMAGTESALRVSETSGAGKVIIIESRNKVLNKDEVAVAYYEVLADTMFVKKLVIATVPGSDLATSTGFDAYTASDPDKTVIEYSYR